MRRLRSITSLLFAVGLLVVPSGYAAFPGKNGLIATVRAAPYNDVWLLNPRTGVARALHGGKEPAWSPDGKKLLTTVGHTDTEIVAEDLRGQVFPHNSCRYVGSGRLFAESGSWSPDGRHFAFGCSNSDGRIFVGQLGEGPEYATPITDDGWFPAWSPDGTQIAFMRESGIWVMDPDGANQRRLVEVAVRYPTPIRTQLDWSPDSRRLVFVQDSDPPRECCEIGNYDVYTVRRDGSELTRLTTDPSLERSAAFSPDGRQIVFSTNRPGTYELYLMKTDGRDQRRLTFVTPRSNGDGFFDADWQPVAPGLRRPCVFQRGTISFTQDVGCKRTLWP